MGFPFDTKKAFFCSWYQGTTVDLSPLPSHKYTFLLVPRAAGFVVANRFAYGEPLWVDSGCVVIILKLKILLLKDVAVGQHMSTPKVPFEREIETSYVVVFFVAFVLGVLGIYFLQRYGCLNWPAWCTLRPFSHLWFKMDSPLKPTKGQTLSKLGKHSKVTDPLGFRLVLPLAQLTRCMERIRALKLAAHAELLHDSLQVPVGRWRDS